LVEYVAVQGAGRNGQCRTQARNGDCWRGLSEPGEQIGKIGPRRCWTAALRSAGVKIEDLEIGLADLEDVFLEIMQEWVGA